MFCLDAHEFFYKGVSLALKYWASSFDEQGTSLGLVHLALHRLRSLLPSTGNDFYKRGIDDVSGDFWLRVYCGLAAVNLAFYALRAGFFLRRGVVASRAIYAQLVERILGARTRFFDSTPTGRILNRLSDIQVIDQELPPVAMFLLLEVFGVLGIVGTISAVLPVFFFASIIVTAVYFVIGFIYLALSRELKRSESVSRSPIFSVFGETLDGLTTIRVRCELFLESFNGDNKANASSSWCRRLMGIP